MRKAKRLISLLAILGMFHGIGNALEYTVNDWFTIHAPWQNVGIVGIYDFVSKENVIGIEGQFISFPNATGLFITAGGLVDASDDNDGELRNEKRSFLEKGTPFIGVKYEFPQDFLLAVLPSVISDRLHIGLAVGYNLEQGEPLAGFKATVDVLRF